MSCWSRLRALAHVSLNPRKEPLVSAHRAGRRGKEAGWLCSRLQCYGDALSGVVGMRGNTRAQNDQCMWLDEIFSVVSACPAILVAPPCGHLAVGADEDPNPCGYQHKDREDLERKQHVVHGGAGRSQQREDQRT